MTLPAELLEAVSAPGGGKITLVVGAGCSFEAPTSIPLAGRLSQECHDRLVANAVLAIGDCSTPWNLSSLADAVVAKTGKQQLLVEQLSQHYDLRIAAPNEGHRLAAALLREGAITSILTLNFDLALTTAISGLGVGDRVGIIDSPRDLANRKAVNLYYLHRNAAEADPETWILRTEALTSEWKGKWEGAVAAKALAVPVVVFAGLGDPADVLIESTKLIQQAMSGIRTYQVDPVDCDESEFYKALDLDPSEFIQATWCDFMADLSQRLLVAHTSQLRTAAETIVTREHLAAEDLTALLSRLEEIGLLKVGRLRACWLFHEKPYCPEELHDREQIADLLLAAALIARVTNTTAVLFDDGIVEFRRDDRIVATHVFVSGGGTRSRSAIESELSMRKRRYRGRSAPPGGAVIAGTSDNGGGPITPPADLLLGETSGSIVLGPSALQLFHVASLRQDSAQCQEVAP